MVVISPQEMKKQAQIFTEAGKVWHVHFFTPDCKLNDSDQYVTLLECPSEKYIAQYLNQSADKALVGELTSVLHGVNIKQDIKAKPSAASGSGAKIIQRAQKLNEQGVSWHHHMLFPNCKFNEDSGWWALVLEDPLEDRLLKSLTDTEPKADLESLEPLFYSAK